MLGYYRSPGRGERDCMRTAGVEKEWISLRDISEVESTDLRVKFNMVGVRKGKMDKWP